MANHKIICPLCQQSFATIYTYRRHRLAAHSDKDNEQTMSDASQETMSNSESEVSDSDIDQDNSIEESQPDQQEDFWSLLIAKTVRELIYNGENFQNVTHVEQFLREPALSLFMAELQNTFEEIMQIV